MNDEYKAVIMMNLRDFDAGRTARHGTYDLEGKLAELERVYAEAAEVPVLLAEIEHLTEVKNDLIWQRDTDETHARKAAAFDRIVDVLDDGSGPIWFTVNAKRVIEQYEGGAYDGL